jgi:F0F1-type ATP synthase assembly protein I
MRDDRVSMDRDAVESMQDNLSRGEPVILASYALIGAILLLGGAGFLADRFLGTRPWCLLIGLLVGLCVGFFRLGRVIHHR